jgi:hypothetical protein
MGTPMRLGADRTVNVEVTQLRLRDVNSHVTGQLQTCVHREPPFSSCPRET